MALLSPDDEALLKRAYQRVQDGALLPGDERYQPLYSDLAEDDPVQRLRQHVEWTEVESIQLFTGFRGSGKTTELLRLCAELGDPEAAQLAPDAQVQVRSGIVASAPAPAAAPPVGTRAAAAADRIRTVVLYGDALRYVSSGDPIEIAELLWVVAGAFSDAVENHPGLKLNLAGRTWWQRAWDYLNRTSLTISEASVKSEGESPAASLLGGVKAGIELKVALRNDPAFRTRLQQFLAPRLAAVHNEVAAFVEEGVKLIRKRCGSECRVVFLFDSLEKIQGTRFTEDEVRGSVTRLFSQHLDDLRLPGVHVVCTVPPWLEFAVPNLLEPIRVPGVPLWRNDAQRTVRPERVSTLRQAIVRRFGEAGYERFFGTPVDLSLVDPLVQASGGHLLDVLMLLREVLLAAQRAGTVPVTPDVVARAVARVRRQYAHPSVRDAHRLAQIAETRQPIRRDDSSEEVYWLTRLLDTRFVLYFRNGADWYDVHPLAREAVTELCRQFPEPPSPTRPPTP